MEIADSIYQAIRVTLYENTINYSHEAGSVLGEYLVTPEYEGKITTKFNILDTVPKEYNLSFIKEFDRLTVNGTFSGGEVVYIILEGNRETKRYLVPTVENSISPVCFSVCDDGLIDVTFFINEEGVFGRYNISIIINGKVYNTYKNVIFE